MKNKKVKRVLWFSFWAVLGILFWKVTPYELQEADYYIHALGCSGCVLLLIYATKRLVSAFKETREEFQRLKSKRKH